MTTPVAVNFIAEGDSFESFRALKDAVKLWAITAKFAYTVVDSDKQRVRIGCRGERGCPFRVNARWKENVERALVTKVVDRHICLGGVILGHQITSSMTWLKQEIPRLLEVDKKTTTKSIKSVLRI